MAAVPPVYPLMKAIRYPRRAWNALRSSWRTHFQWDASVARLRQPRVLGPVEVTEATRNEIITELASRGVTVEHHRIDVADYGNFLQRAKYERFPFYYAGGREQGFHEKSIEHFLAAKLLCLGSDDVYIDVASDYSTAPDIYRDIFNCTTFVQDLSYPTGIHGNRIGGSAAAMPVEAEFATAMALHNSFEHFEDDHDIGFVREASRVLRPGGRVCIVPLFLFTRYAIQTDPVELPREGLAFDEGAVLYAARGWRNRHGRWYDAAHLISRLLENAPPLRARVLNIVNSRDLHPECYLQFALVLEKPQRV